MSNVPKHIDSRACVEGVLGVDDKETVIFLCIHFSPDRRYSMHRTIKSCLLTGAGLIATAHFSCVRSCYHKNALGCRAPNDITYTNWVGFQLVPFPALTRDKQVGLGTRPKVGNHSPSIRQTLQRLRVGAETLAHGIGAGF